MKININNDQVTKERNRQRRKKRLEKHTGVDWIDPEKGYGSVRGEQALWRAVILQMLEDAASGSSKPNDQYNKHMARHWLTSPSADFYMVCDLAGFDVEYLRKNIKRALLNNCKWRTANKNNAQAKDPKKPRPILKAKALPVERQPKEASVVMLQPFHQKTA